MREYGHLNVPDNPIIPFIEGDGVGPEITAAMIKIINAIDRTIRNKTVTGDFAHMMKDATGLTRSRFADTVVSNMKSIVFGFSIN